MKKVLSFLLLLLVLTACNDNDEPKGNVIHDKVNKTVLVYLAGDNSLKGFVMKDIDEMLKGMESVNSSLCNLLVYVDDGNTPQLIRVGKTDKNRVTKEIIKEYPDQNSVNVSVMKDVLSTAFEYYPAENYGLVLWSHGDGWLPYKRKAATRWWGEDTSEGDDYMNISELHDALKVAPHLDYILFDACFMASVEVAYELRDCADYILGSPTEIPGPGAPYQDVAPAMFVEGNAAINIANAYCEYYIGLYNGGVGLSNDNWTGGSSMAVVKTSELENLATATAQIISEYVPSEQYIDITNIMCYDMRSSKYYHDLNGLIYKLTGGNDDYKMWEQMFDKTVVYWKTTEKNFSAFYPFLGGMFSMENSKGLSTYIIRSDKEELNAFYRQNDWYSAAGWGKVFK